MMQTPEHDADQYGSAHIDEHCQKRCEPQFLERLENTRGGIGYLATDAVTQCDA
jgi:hypothetical protein